MKKIVKDVCGALIKRGNKYLVARRKKEDSFGGLWEFPGGVIEKEEKKEEALKREIKEEIGVDIEIKKEVSRFEDEIPGLKVNIYLFECDIKEGIPKAIDCEDVRWVTLDELERLKLAPADQKILEWIKISN